MKAKKPFDKKLYSYFQRNTKELNYKQQIELIDKLRKDVISNDINAVEEIWLECHNDINKTHKRIG